MKKIIYLKRFKLYISLLFIICSHSAMSQYCFSNNGQFANIGSAYTSAHCYFDDNYVINWHRSHGTPQYYRIASNPTASYMYMWATYDGGFGGRGPVGEGIWGGFNFQANHHYTIKVAAYNARDNGNLVVLGANGVPTTTESLYCQGEDLPNVPGTTIIMNHYLPGHDNSYTEYVATFTPTVNYNQVWIYPSTWGYEMQMYVDYVSICENDCIENITYNSGLLPGGETRADFIYAGSTSGTGGSGTVTAQNGVTTSLIGGQAVILVPEFQAQLTSGEFRAWIIPCASAQQARVQTQPSKYPSFPEYPSVPAQLDPRGLIPSRGGTSVLRSDSSGLARARPGPPNMAIYPNPAVTKLKIQINNFTGNISGIQVLNEVGIAVQQVDRKTYVNAQNLEIDVSRLPDGMYILKVITDEQTFTQKFQKLKQR